LLLSDRSTRETTLNALLIAGTDNGVGKTVLTSALAAYWQRYSSAPLGVIKPVQCGSEHSHANYPAGERQLYPQLFSLEQSAESINPLYFTSPLAPPLAAAQEGRQIDLEQLWKPLEQLMQQRSFVLVEGWGGLGSPITAETTLADIAWDWRIPVVLVVPVTPGALAQTVANVALARHARIHLKGIVLNCLHPCHLNEREEWAPVELLQSLTNKPVLGCIPHLANPTDLNKLVQVASDLALDQVLPLG
jgi:dethiobiotin synthetase